MVSNGVYIYFGCKMTENEIRAMFDNDEYIEYIEYREKCECKNKKIKTKKFNYIHEFDRHSFYNFVNDKLKKNIMVKLELFFPHVVYTMKIIVGLLELKKHILICMK